MNVHPNATATTVVGAITIIIVWLLGYFGVAVPAEVGSAVTTVAAALVLYLAGPKSSRRP